MTASSWDESYIGDTPAPWDIGRPQPAFVRLAEQGLLSGRVLDVGCGTGEQVLLAAAHGASEVVGIDISPRAIGKAREKAAERGISARFEVGDALNLSTQERGFSTIIDSGVFHVFSDEDRPRYVASVASALEPGGRLFLMCFSDKQPGDFGPRRVREEELRDAFRDGWTVESITAGTFEINPLGSTTQAQAWLAVIRRD
jgi:cyclopropane fatty-acyl-phospholipid synthase-like methyltransferase